MTVIPPYSDRALFVRDGERVRPIPQPPNGSWEPVETYPHDERPQVRQHACWQKPWPPRVRVMLPSGEIHEDAHFAQDLSGEEQPCFSGWFVPGTNEFRGIDKPAFWQPCTAR